MKLRHWLVDKKVYFMAHGTTLFLLMLLLSVIGLNSNGQVFVLIFMIFGHLSFLSYDYFRRFQFYKELKENLEGLDKKTLISELVDVPNFYEGELIHHIITEVTKSMNDDISVYKKQWKDYRDYIETWVHEIKTPLAASELIIKNNNNEVSKSIHEEIDKVEAYVEQALFYARSNHLEKDYVIKPVTLDALVKESLRKHSKLLISKKCEVQMNHLEMEVYTDPKWLTFILSQIIGNSIKYSNTPMYLEFGTMINSESVILEITDHGYGIEPTDISSIFKKGFVGINGRNEGKSTGIGLYLCRELCSKMGLSIHIESEVDIYTKVSINFPMTQHVHFK
ncbi:MAG: sensor histidine kinase [Clostridiales bacterium]|nr:sensor histidine kinase [Clostridiales bacterium]